MARKSRSRSVSYTPSPTDSSGGAYGNFNNPDLNDRGEARNKPIETAMQAYQVYLRFKKQNRVRANRNRLIADRYNGEPPYDQKDLEEQGQGWRSNVSTLFLASIIDRVTPRFSQAVHDIKYLTASELPDTYDDFVNKSEQFQAATTKLIRQWADWTDFVQRVVTENVINGYTIAVNMDEHNWRPRTVRQEQWYVDEQAPQTVHRLQCFCIEQDYFIHELISLLQEPETTAKAGFNIDNLRKAIDYAMPPRTDLPSDPRQLSDMAREGSLYFSWHRAAKMIQTVHVFVVNYNEGKVDHWWCNRNASAIGEPTPQSEDESGGGEELFYSENVAHQMEDVITFFSFQAGNDRLFGSKGLGRQLVNISISIERARNLYFDQQYIAGLLIGTAEEKDVPYLQPRVMSPFLILPKGFELMAQQLQFNPETFAQLDAKLSQIAEIIAGAFIPQQVQANGTPAGQQTATEATIEATKEEEIRQGILNRFWNQFTRLISQMQRRIYSPINIKAALEYREARDEAALTGMKLVNEETMDLLLDIDPAADESYEIAPELGRADEQAVATIVDLLDAELTPDEILVLAYTPATEFNANVGAIEDNKLLQFAAVAQGNPYWDQGKLNYESGVAMIGFRRAKDLFAGDPAMSTNLESQREQYSEFSDMLGGQAMPVSDRDDHVQHLQALGQKVFAMLNTMRQMPPEAIPENDLNAMNLALTHGKAHIEAENKKPTGTKAGARGKRTKQLQPLTRGLEEAEKAFNQLLDTRAKAQQQAAFAGSHPPPPAWTNPAFRPAPVPPGVRPALGGAGPAQNPGGSAAAPMQSPPGAPAALPMPARAPGPGLNPSG
jgi:hypothetical protein